MKLTTRLLAIAALMLGANASYAIPFEVEVGTDGDCGFFTCGGSSGFWAILGGSDGAAGAWDHNPDGYDFWSGDLDPGLYIWTIDAVYGRNNVFGWRLAVGGNTLSAGISTARFGFLIDGGVVKAVPEPATLGLLGIALCAAGFAARRRTRDPV